MDTADDWMDPDTDERDDVCHHGLGFDVACEDCEIELREELAKRRGDVRKPQGHGS